MPSTPQAMASDAVLWGVLERTRVSPHVERRRRNVLERLQRAVERWIRNEGQLDHKVVRSVDQGSQHVQEGTCQEGKQGEGREREAPSDVQVVAFGSTIMGLSHPHSDMDVSVVMPHCCPEDRGKVLQRIDKVMRSMCRGTRTDVRLIKNARVPVLRYLDALHKVQCDVTVNAGGSAYKSEAIGLLLGHDERAVGLAKLVKMWAKSQGINDPSGGTFNSYSLVLLVIVFLQCQRPAVLPPLKEVLFSPNVPACLSKKDRKRTEPCGNPVTWSILLQNLRVHGTDWKSRSDARKNQKPLSELLEDFYVFQDENLAQCRPHMRACAYHGRVTGTSLSRGGPFLDVVDPFDEEENCARTVRRLGCLGRIKKSFRLAASKVREGRGNAHLWLCPGDEWFAAECLHGMAEMSLDEVMNEGPDGNPAQDWEIDHAMRQKAVPQPPHQPAKPKQSKSGNKPGQELGVRSAAEKPKQSKSGNKPGQELGVRSAAEKPKQSKSGNKPGQELGVRSAAEKPKQSKSGNKPGQELGVRSAAEKPKRKDSLVESGPTIPAPPHPKEGSAVQSAPNSELYRCPFCPFSCEAIDLKAKKSHKKDVQHVANRVLQLYSDCIVRRGKSLACKGCSKAQCSMKSKENIVAFEKHVRLLQSSKGKTLKGWKRKCSVPHIEEVEGCTAYICMKCAVTINTSNVCGILALLEHAGPHEQFK